MTIHGRSVEFSSDFQLPEFGLLEFDFVSMVKPDKASKPCDVAQFYELMRTLKDDRRGSDETTVLTFLKEFMSRNLLNTFQALRIMNGCFRTDEYRIEFLVTIFRRLTDHYDFCILKEQLSHDANILLARRLGSLVLLNTERPDGRYTLDLAIRDERCLLSCLLHLSQGHRQHFHHWTFNGEKSSISRSWFVDHASIATSGIVEFSYVAEIEDNIVWHHHSPAASKSGFEDAKVIALEHVESQEQHDDVHQAVERQSVKEIAQQRRVTLNHETSVRKVRIDPGPMRHKGTSSAHHVVG